MLLESTRIKLNAFALGAFMAGLTYTQIQVLQLHYPTPL